MMKCKHGLGCGGREEVSGEGGISDRYDVGGIGVVMSIIRMHGHRRE